MRTRTVKGAGWQVLVARELKSLGVILDDRLSFDSHVGVTCMSCGYHVWALWHIRHMITKETAQTLACSIVMSRLDLWYSLPYDTTDYVLSTLQRVQKNLARVATQSSPGPMHHLCSLNVIGYQSTTGLPRNREFELTSSVRHPHRNTFNCLVTVPPTVRYSLPSANRPPTVCAKS